MDSEQQIEQDNLVEDLDQIEPEKEQEKEANLLLNNVKCDQCGMLFTSSETLRVHKDKFCIGVQDSGVNRTQSPPINSKYIQNINKKGFNEFEAQTPTPRSDKISIYSQTRSIASPTNKNESNLNPSKTQSAISELKNYKNKKSIEQSLQDLEDTLVRDTIRDKKLITSFNPSPESLKSKQQEPIETDPYKKLLNDYTELKKKEKQILQEVYEYNPEFKPIGSNKENNLIKHDFLSLFDSFDDFDLDNLSLIDFENSYRPKMSDETRLNLKRIQERTEQLEKERQEMQFKIESLRNNTSYQLPIRSSQSVNRVLTELKDQQRINEAALSLLKQRLLSDSKATKSQILPPIYPNYTSSVPNMYSSQTNFFNNFFDQSLDAEEIRLMRLNYLQNGGHDQNILNRFTELEYNARFRDNNNTNRVNNPLNTIDKPDINSFKTDTNSLKIQNKILRNALNADNDDIDNKSNKSFPLVSDLFATDALTNPNTIELDNKIKRIDSENKRIQAELELLQYKYQNLANSNTSSVENNKKHNEINLPPIQQNQPVYANYPPPSQTNRINQSQRNNQYKAQPQQTPKLIRLKDLPPSPYDPNGGFILFIDFVTNFEQSYGSARIITCLHHPKSGLGEPSVLPIVGCESYNDNGNQTTLALISTKQPVPRCPPQQALTILIELQMAFKNTNENRLKSCAWTKIPLFDSKNRLLSGRWKCVLKNLPIKSDTTIANLDSIPEYGYTELYYRLVNLRDSEEQTNAPISPAYADQYTPTNQDELEKPVDELNNIIKTNSNNENNHLLNNIKAQEQLNNSVDDDRDNNSSQEYAWKQKQLEQQKLQQQQQQQKQQNNFYSKRKIFFKPDWKY